MKKQKVIDELKKTILLLNKEIDNIRKDTYEDQSKIVDIEKRIDKLLKERRSIILDSILNK